MYTIAVICYSFGGFALLIATLLWLHGVKKPEKRPPNNWVDAIFKPLEDLPYGIRLLCRWTYLILLPLGSLLHYLSTL